MNSHDLHQNRTFAVAGLAGEATIVVDTWGIPHIEALSLDDLWFVQGFNAARDRLWQIDLWRKRGLGLLAADFGPGFLEQDRAARHFLYRGEMAAEWAAYADDAPAICGRFVAGINAYVALTERKPGLLPPEFTRLGTKPARWAAEDVVRIRSHGLTRNALSEVARLAMLELAGAEADLLRKFVEPAGDVSPPPGIVSADAPVEALALFRLAQANVTFSPERLAARLEDAPRWRLVNEQNEVFVDPEFSGSNNWVVAGARTASGLPILASDPHRAHALPSLRYIAHLKAPGYSAIGAGEPAVPGLSFGHNGEAAFGMTIFGADQEDVYVLETDPADPLAYRFGAGWERMHEVRDSIAVKGEADQPLTLRFARQGPVIWRNAAGTRAIAIRSVWFEPGTAPYMAGLELLRARTHQAFRAAAERWRAPSANLVYADRAGSIAWSAAGLMPLRRNWSGLAPVPGDGSHEWSGFIPASALPYVLNPEKGFFATANEFNLPADWPHATMPIGFEWTEASRARRIHEVLGADTRHSVAAAQALQTDIVSLPARRMLALVAKLDPGAEAAPALAVLAGWDCRLEASSAAAALFEVWFTKHLKPALFMTLVPDAKARALMAPGDVEGILRALEAPDARYGDDPARARDTLLTTTLATAFSDLQARFGADPQVWAWGKLHHGYFEHQLSALAPGDASLDIGPLAKGGSGSTPMHTGYRASDFRIVHGASFRMVVDLADLDASTVINAPGQSGDRRSAHYGDLAPLWAAGRYVPMLWTREAIARNTHFTWRLVPG